MRLTAAPPNGDPRMPAALTSASAARGRVVRAAPGRAVGGARAGGLCSCPATARMPAICRLRRGGPRAGGPGALVPADPAPADPLPAPAVAPVPTADGPSPVLPGGGPRASPLLTAAPRWRPCRRPPGRHPAASGGGPQDGRPAGGPLSPEVVFVLLMAAPRWHPRPGGTRAAGPRAATRPPAPGGGPQDGRPGGRAPAASGRVRAAYGRVGGFAAPGRPVFLPSAARWSVCRWPRGLGAPRIRCPRRLWRRCRRPTVRHLFCRAAARVPAACGRSPAARGRVRAARGCTARGACPSGPGAAPVPAGRRPAWAGPLRSRSCCRRSCRVDRLGASVPRYRRAAAAAAAPPPPQCPRRSAPGAVSLVRVAWVRARRWPACRLVAGGGVCAACMCAAGAGRCSRGCAARMPVVGRLLSVARGAGCLRLCGLGALRIGCPCRAGGVGGVVGLCSYGPAGRRAGALRPAGPRSGGRVRVARRGAGGAGGTGGVGVQGEGGRVPCSAPPGARRARPPRWGWGVRWWFWWTWGAGPGLLRRLPRAWRRRSRG
ncbi:hypothetical protein J2S46_008210 [Kitasatospora herbaricolor]|nr:hypothetical protein [Kitasatospora herbaricolor]